MEIWGEVELEPEVAAWFLSLSTRDRARAARYIDLLAERGPLLDEPFTRQLRGRLRELRFHLGREQRRITYFLTGDRRIILLTTFRKAARHERGEIDRADTAMRRCRAAGHTANDADG